MSVDAPSRPPAGAPGPDPDVSLTRGQLPAWAVTLVLSVGVLAILTLHFGVGWGLPSSIALVWLIVLLALPLWSLIIEGRRKAVDRLVTGVVTSAFGVALLPLVSIIWKVVEEGGSAFSAEFFTYSMRNVVGEGGGIYHAAIGTLLMTLGAAVISVPIGLFTSIYLVEYGKNGPLAKAITFLVDVMTGIPSIVAGLFAFALFALIFDDPGIRMGFGGSVALAVLMIPVVVRSCEEMLKLVPNELREASYALGIPKWRTIVKVVLPTSIAGIVTGVTLSIARVIGETAPLLIIAGATDSVNLNLFDGRMASLPVFTYFQVQVPGAWPEFALERAWGAALTLIIIVMVLNIVARLISYFFSPKGEH